MNTVILPFHDMLMTAWLYIFSADLYLCQKYVSSFELALAIQILATNPAS